MRIAVVTGSRADWGLLLPVLREIQQQPKWEIKLWVTGSHLEARFGYTIDAIEAAGFTADACIPLQLSTDTASDTANALASAISGFAELLQDSLVDLLLVLGDRYEVFGAVQAALFAQVPVAHIAGGDVSEGAYDDAMRHAISKLAHLHFPTNAPAQMRLLQMGEAPQRVILSGSPGIDAILATPRVSRAVLAEYLGFTWQTQNLAVSFHPATLDALSVEQQLDALLQGLMGINPAIGIVLSGSNADTGGDRINQALQALAVQRPHTCFVQSLGAQRYYSLLAEVDLLVGNSSSGLYEAPSLGTPTLDIGSRQAGRLRGPSVVHCDYEATSISITITRLLKDPPDCFNNPYGDGAAAPRIVAALCAIDDPRALLQKHFHLEAST